MKESNSIDPYAPPRAEPLTVFSDGNDSGSLWRVVDGRLQFRDGAVLPDIGPDGSPNGEPGPRFSLALETKALPALMRGLGLPILGFASLSGILPWGGAKIGAFFPLFWLPYWLGPKVRIHLVRSKSRERSILYRLLFGTLAVGLLLSTVLLNWLKAHAADLLLYPWIVLGILQLVLLITGKAPHAREVEDGWFEWSYLKPEAILHLEEIQRSRPPVGPT